uniref:Uncharacterized protein n=1 Tax=Anguilla anguilla TaxID=7936 RepID=A0A0E9TQ50_ANGAN
MLYCFWNKVRTALNY